MDQTLDLWICWSKRLVKPFENPIKSIYPPLSFPLGKGSLQVSPHPNTVPFIKLYIHKRSVHDYVCPCHINLPNILDVLFYRFVSSVQLQRRWGREKEEPLRYYATRERCNPDCETSWTSEFLSCRIARALRTGAQMFASTEMHLPRVLSGYLVLGLFSD